MLKHQVLVIFPGNVNIRVLLLTTRNRKGHGAMDVFSLELYAKSQYEAWQITGLVK
jgi:hypothetical protein